MWSALYLPVELVWTASYLETRVEEEPTQSGAGLFGFSVWIWVDVSGVWTLMKRGEIRR